MELRQLRYFVKAADSGNFTHAANELYISQSTLSQQIKQLEDSIGIDLFERNGKRVRLTEAGQLFLPYARRTLEDAEDGQQKVKDLMHLQTGTLHIGATYGLSSLLVNTLTSFNKKYPRINIKIEFGNTEMLLEKLHLRDIDLLLSFLPPEQDENLIIQPLFSSKLSLIANRKSKIAGKKSISLKQLQQLPLALPSKKYSIRNYLDRLLEEQDIQLPSSIEVNDINMLLQLADTGNWYTLLMSSSLFNFPALKAIPVTGSDMTRQATLCYLKAAYKKNASVAFESILKSVCPSYKEKP